MGEGTLLLLRLGTPRPAPFQIHQCQKRTECLPVTQQISAGCCCCCSRLQSPGVLIRSPTCCFCRGERGVFLNLPVCVCSEMLSAFPPSPSPSLLFWRQLIAD